MSASFTTNKSGKATVFTFPEVAPVSSIDVNTLELCGCKMAEQELHCGMLHEDVTEPKTLHLVLFPGIVPANKFVSCLNSLGTKPCESASNYLFGLMRKVPALEMPYLIRRARRIAAIETGPRIITEQSQPTPFIFVLNWNLSRIVGNDVPTTSWSTRWAFLAQDLEPDSMNIQP